MTTLHLHNTRTRRKEAFAPLDPGNVRMYVCGPTVYDRAHLGNARPVVVFDVLYRLLRHVYGADHVTYARNFTDVDDKINTRAAENVGESGDVNTEITRITAMTIQWFLDDMGELGALEPSIRGKEHEKAMPRATEYIDEMIDMISDLIARGHAYEAEGHVLFSVESYPDYGALSGRSVEDMIAGARVEVAPYKRNPMDFILWKPSSGDQPGWDSPWGWGRPGWHIECSAMSHELLGASFDIHGGGGDLMFPHHENEVAQSCCAHPESGFAQVWMHNEMLQVEGRKMSKSLGNFFTVRDLLDQGIPGEVIRFVMLSTHYRKPMDWTEKKTIEATGRLTKYQTLQRELLDTYPELSSWTGEVDREIIQALASDLNSPLALTRLHKLAGEAMSVRTFGVKAASGFLASLRFLGFGNLNVQSQRSDKAIEKAIDAQEIVESLISDMDEARAAKDYATADSIRSKLTAASVRVSTGKSGTEWEFSPDFDPSKLDALK